MPLTRGLALRLVVVALATAAATACEVIVGATPSGPIQCEPVPGACPGGQECLGGTCVACAAPGCGVLVDAGRDVTVIDAHADSGHDAGVDVHVQPTPDTGVDSGPAAIGHACTTNAGCASGFCAIPTDLPALGLAEGICSETCCSNADCGGAGFTCYPTPGGNLCVPTGVAKCSGACPTSCCGGSGCGGGEACGLPDGGATPYCYSFGGDQSICSFGTGGGGDGCSLSTDCQSGLCLGSGACGTCTTPCCQDSDCSGSNKCQWEEIVDQDQTPTAFARACGAAASGAAKTGDSCTATTSWAGTECAGGVCFNGTCTGPCCTDSDCAALTGGSWKCLPYDVTLGSGAVPLLVCQKLH
jgi:hypothetical protein